MAISALFAPLLSPEHRYDDRARAALIFAADLALALTRRG